jgi:hypothetical protein
VIDSQFWPKAPEHPRDVVMRILASENCCWVTAHYFLILPMSLGNHTTKATSWVMILQTLEDKKVYGRQWVPWDLLAPAFSGGQSAVSIWLAGRHSFAKRNWSNCNSLLAKWTLLGYHLKCWIQPVTFTMLNPLIPCSCEHTEAFG